MVVVACSGGNLNAMAQRGDRESVPSSSWNERRFYLENGSIDLYGKFFSPGEKFGVVGHCGFDSATRPGFRGNDEAALFEVLEDLRLGLQRGVRTLREPVGAKFEGAQPGSIDFVDLAQRSGCGIPGVGKRFFAAFGPRLVEASEACQREHDLAAHGSEFGRGRVAATSGESRGRGEGSQ